ncbi:MAG TPA: M3 family oligoendopeptidase [Chitinophagales bacterium]|nr:M3 family oligoendopeptidase [Chitinophagales bacterium]
MKTITRKDRKYLAENLAVHTWQDIESYYNELLNREIDSKENLLKWIADRSETDAVVDEEYRWRYIRQTCDTENETYTDAYEDFIQTIMPSWMTVTNQLNKKLSSSTFINELDQSRFFVYLRNLKTQLQIFREENIPLSQQTQLLAQEYGSTIGAMTIEHDGNEYTLPQAAVFLQNQDRSLRKIIFEKTNNRRYQDRDKLNKLFDELLKIRHQIAQNAGFKNFRDYMFAEMGRFDYDVTSCEQFHEAIKTEVIPLVKKIHQKRKQQLNVDKLFPYDLEVDAENLPALKPFSTQDELIEKSVTCLNKVDPFFAECISIMDNMHYLDLNSRKGKAPGGYNMTLPEIGVPFIFMNAAGTHRDLETMVHEAGHAVHSFLMRTLPYNFDQDISSESAELASMSMELMTFDGLDAFYNEADKKRAIETHLEGIITMLPWIALIDKFQHWIYTNPTHTSEDRENKWLELSKELSSDEVDWSGYEDFRKALWHKQLHIFEVPFYYIEYGIAQLGALAVWRNYKQNKAKAIEDYKNALQLGYTKPIPEMYKTAGIEFNFSAEYVKELMDFLSKELNS